MQEKTIQTQTCKHCNLNFEITDRDLEFYDKISPIFNWKKYQIPTPTLCPDCRTQRRMTFRNERSLYKRKCDATGKNIISMYSPDKKIKVYDQSFWWSDKWDALDYWIDFDFNKSFFEQFSNLLKEVPQPNVFTEKNQNSDYTQYEWSSKDCYLICWWSGNEKCFYWTYYMDSNTCFDCYWTWNSEKCYELVECKNCYNCFWSEHLESCSNCYFSYNLKWCKNCFMSGNLTNKEYYINNRKYQKEEYQNIVNEILKTKKVSEIKEQYWNFKENLIRKNVLILNSEKCIWDNIDNSKKCFNCYLVEEWDNCKYCHIIARSKDCYDVYVAGMIEKCYEISSSWTYNVNESEVEVLFWNRVISCYKTLYSSVCFHSSHLFWCVWLRNKQYCILNKQYTKQEYNELVPKIIKHMQSSSEWWEFFPSSISPFWYNETVAQEYFPLTPPSVPPLSGEGSKMFQFSLSPGRGKMSEGQIGVSNWSDYEPPKPNVEKIIPAEKLPENIKDIPDDMLNWAIMCETTQKPFRIIKQELDFYRKHNLPIPRKHPDQRHLERMQLRNPRKLFDRKCDKCWIDIKTTYSPDRPEIVYCEKCYEKEVY